MGVEHNEKLEEEEAEEVKGRVLIGLEQWKQKKQTQMLEIAEKLINGDLQSQIQAALEIRRTVRSASSSSSAAKTRSRFATLGLIQPLILMLSSIHLQAREASLLALLNLAVRNERNKMNIVTLGAIPPLVELLKLQNSKLSEVATAAILTLSAVAPNKSVIASSGAPPLLVKILSFGSIQGKVDAVTTLYNLSSETATTNLAPGAARPLISLLKECKKYSKLAEKTTFLLEILCTSHEGRNAISNCHGGILSLVETVEDGSHASMQHAVGALLSLCQSCRSKYRELILNEGAIPGLLRLTVEGTTESQDRARLLLDLLRDAPPDNRLSPAVFKEIVYDIATKVDGAKKALETEQILLHDMLHRSMELSMN